MIPEPPEIDDSEIWFVSAFYDLSSCRSIGMGVGSIPYTAIIDYIYYWDLDTEIGDLLINIVTAMDSVYIEHVNKKRSLSHADQRQQKPVKKGRPPRHR